jgi:hypothetical protein
MYSVEIAKERSDYVQSRDGDKIDPKRELGSLR